MDESEEAAPAAPLAVLTDGRKVREVWGLQSAIQLCLLDARDEHVIFGEEAIEFDSRPSNSVTVPRKNTAKKRARARVRVDSSDEEEDEEKRE